MRNFVYWPGMDRDKELLVKKLLRLCASGKITTKICILAEDRYSMETIIH